MDKKKYADFIKFSLSKENLKIKKEERKENKNSFIDGKGYVTLESISNNREWFYGKSDDDIFETISSYGYIIERKDSINIKRGSKAKILKITNTSKERNIAQVQVSPGSSRHGDIPYVKISTIDIGKIKIINGTKDQYKTDGKETAKIIFRR